MAEIMGVMLLLGALEEAFKGVRYDRQQKVQWTCEYVV